MKYWWYLHQYRKEPILVTPEEAAAGAAAKKQSRPFDIPRLGMLAVATESIESFEKSGIVIRDDDQLMLEDGFVDDYAPTTREEPMKNPLTGNPYIRWVKRLVPYREWKNQYSKEGRYYLLHKDEDGESGVWMVYGALVYPSLLPQGVRELEKWEVKSMDRRLAGVVGWWNDQPVQPTGVAAA